MPTFYGPTIRPDSKAPHPNVIRRFREELRLDRNEFAELLDCNTDTLRVWEGTKGAKPRGEAALPIIALAKKNKYPLTITDIFPTPPKKKRGKKNNRG